MVKTSTRTLSITLRRSTNAGKIAIIRVRWGRWWDAAAQAMHMRGWMRWDQDTCRLYTNSTFLLHKQPQQQYTVHLQYSSPSCTQYTTEYRSTDRSVSSPRGKLSILKLPPFRSFYITGYLFAASSSSLNSIAVLYTGLVLFHLLLTAVEVTDRIVMTATDQHMHCDLTDRPIATNCYVLCDTPKCTV